MYFVKAGISSEMEAIQQTEVYMYSEHGKPKPMFRRGDRVIWRKNPEYDYQPGRISVVKVPVWRTAEGSIDGYCRPIYRILNLGPFDYYWLDETDIALPDHRIYDLSTEEKSRISLSHFRLQICRKWSYAYKGTNIHAFVTSPIGRLENLGYKFTR